MIAPQASRPPSGIRVARKIDKIAECFNGYRSIRPRMYSVAQVTSDRPSPQSAPYLAHRTCRPVFTLQST